MKIASQKASHYRAIATFGVATAFWTPAASEKYKKNKIIINSLVLPADN